MRTIVAVARCEPGRSTKMGWPLVGLHHLGRTCAAKLFEREEQSEPAKAGDE